MFTEQALIFLCVWCKLQVLIPWEYSVKWSEYCSHQSFFALLSVFLCITSADLLGSFFFWNICCHNLAVLIALITNGNHFWSLFLDPGISCCYTTRWHSLYFCTEEHSQSGGDKVKATHCCVLQKVLIGFDHQTSLFWTSLEVNSLKGTKASRVYFLIFFLRWLLMAESCRENEWNKRLVLIRWTWLALQAASPPSQHSNEQAARWESSNCTRLSSHKSILCTGPCWKG